MIELKEWFETVRTPNDGKSIQITEGNTRYKVTEEVDWDYYSKRTKYPKIWHSGILHLNVVKAWELRKKDLLVLGGMLTLEAAFLKKSI